jgi:type III secretion protein S
MSQEELLVFMNSALWLMLKLSLPAVLIATIVGVLTSLLQAATQVQDQTLPFFTKLCAVVVVLIVYNHWIASQLHTFTLSLFDFLPMV